MNFFSSLFFLPFDTIRDVKFGQSFSILYWLITWLFHYLFVSQIYIKILVEIFQLSGHFQLFFLFQEKSLGLFLLKQTKSTENKTEVDLLSYEFTNKIVFIFLNRTVKDKGKLFGTEDVDTRQEVKLRKRKLFLYFEIIYFNIFKWTCSDRTKFSASLKLYRLGFIWKSLCRYSPILPQKF